MSTRTLLSLVLLLPVVACGEPSRSGSPTGPSAPTGQAPPGGGAVAPIPSGPTLSGTVVVTTSAGTQPLPGATVVYATRDTWMSVPTDAAGHYVIPDIRGGDRRRLLARPPPGTELFQRSATVPGDDGAAALDIELVSTGTLGRRFGSPMLSGVVFTMTVDGRRPFAHTRVLYRSFDGPWYDAYVATDEQGRYQFGRLPPGSGQVGAGNCNDQAQYQRVDIGGDTLADIDLTPLVAGCPGVPF